MMSLLGFLHLIIITCIIITNIYHKVYALRWAHGLIDGLRVCSSLGLFAALIGSLIGSLIGLLICG